MTRSGSEKKIFISQLEEGQQFSDIFLVSRKMLADTKAGKPYLSLTLMDKTGEIEARVWDNAERFDPLTEVGNFIQLQATAKSFRDKLQLGVVSLRRVERESVEIEHFMPASKRPFAEMEKELEDTIKSIADPGLKKLMEEIFQGETLARFVRAPAAKKMHHAYIGGLLEHTLSMVGMARKTAEHYSMLDGDMLICGTLLHDLAKIAEFDFSQLPFSYTDRGRLVGHLVLGVELLRKACEKVPEVAQERVDLLAHIILSHHGKLEFGSPVLPMTPEAMLLHHIDDMDAKMNYMENLQENLTEQGGQWTDYQRPLERFLYLQGPEGGGESQTGPSPELSEMSRKRSPSISNHEAAKRQQSLF